MPDSLILSRFGTFFLISSDVNIKHLFRFLTDHVQFSNHRQDKQYSDTPAKKLIPEFGGRYHGFTEKIANLVLDVESIIRAFILLTHGQVIYWHPIGSQTSEMIATTASFSWLTVKLSKENFPQNSSARFRLLGLFRCGEPWNHSIFIVLPMYICRKSLVVSYTSSDSTLENPINNFFFFDVSCLLRTFR